jgi:hypothetical protein
VGSGYSAEQRKTVRVDEEVFETDDPRWLSHKRTLHELFEAESTAECDLASIVPTTTAGVCALLKWCRSLSFYEDENDKWGHSWHYFVNRDIVECLGFGCLRHLEARRFTLGPFPSRNFHPRCGLSRRAGQSGVATGAVRFQIEGELSMKKAIFVGLAILAVSTSGALAKKASKPKAPAAATAATTTPTAPAPFMMGQVSAKDREMYEKNQREAGMKTK